MVETTFTTPRGEVVVTDFMLPRGKHSHLSRIVLGVRGRVAMRMELVLRFDYGRTIPWVTSVGDELRAVAGPDRVVLRTKAPLRGEGMKTVSDFTVGPGQKVVFTLSYGSSLEAPPPRVDSQKALTQTRDYWRRWSRRSRYTGAYADAVERSLMTLKALTFRRSGGVIAAVTTSLPEKIGGSRNWDYRYCWLRDTAFTLLGLMRAGYVDEADAWRRWLLRAVAGTPDQTGPPRPLHTRPVETVRQRVAATRPGNMGDTRRTAALYAFEGNGVGRARSQRLSTLSALMAMERWRVGSVCVRESITRSARRASTKD